MKEEELVLTPDEPFAGLASFTEGNKSFFKGRDKEIEKILSRTEDKTLTLLYGKSGIGKSSIIRAGVFPELRKKLYLPIDIKWDLLIHSTNADQLFDIIIDLIKAELDNRDIDTTIDSQYSTFIDNNQNIISSLRGGDKFWLYLNTNCFWDKKNNIVIPLILFDQFERIFHTSVEKDFFQFLQQAIEIRYPKPLAEKEFQYHFNEYRTKFKLMIVLQEDFLPDQTMHEKEIPTLLRNKYRLKPFDERKAKDAILLPCQNNRIINDRTATEIVKYLTVTDEPIVEENYTETVPLGNTEIEPILLSVVCKKLNDERKREGSSQITSDLLERWTEKDKLLKDFYNDILCETVRDKAERSRLKIIIEDNLLTEAGDLDFEDETSILQKFTSNNLDEALLNKLIKKRILRREPFLGRQRIYIIHNKLAKAIAQEKSERIFEQRRTEEERKIKQAKEDAENKLKTEQQKNDLLLLTRKKNRLTFFAASLAVLFLVAIGFILLENNRTKIKTKLAYADSLNIRERERAMQANLLVRQRAIIYDDSLKSIKARARQKIINDSLALASKSIKLYKTLLTEKEQINQQLTNSLIEIGKQKEQIIRKSDLLQESNYKYGIAEDFRKRNIISKDLDSNLFQQTTEKLLALKQLNGSEETAYTNLLNNIDSLLQAKKYILANTDQGRGLRIAYNIWQENKDPLIESILKTFINKTLYYKYQTGFGDQTNTASSYSALYSLPSDNSINNVLAFSNKDNRLYFDFNNHIFAPRFYNDSITGMEPVGLDSAYVKYASFNNLRLNGISFDPSTNDISYLLNPSSKAQIFSWNAKQGLRAGKEFNIGHFSRYYLSPNQKYLITYDGYYKLWKVQNLGNQKNQKNYFPFFNQRFAQTVTFSDDSKKVAFLNDDNSISIYDLDEDSPTLNKNDINPSFITANFVFNDRAIAGYTTQSSNNRIYIRYLEGDNALKNPTFVNITDDSIKAILRTANRVSISKSGKVLLINSANAAVMCRLSDTSTFFGNNINPQEISFKKISLRNNLNSCLINDSLVASVDANQQMYIWKLYPDFENLSDFFSVVKFPDNINLLLSSDDPVFLQNNAITFYNKYFNPVAIDEKPDSSNLKSAAALYDKLYAIDTANKQVYASRLINIYEQLATLDTTLGNTGIYFKRLMSVVKESYKPMYNFKLLSSFYGSASWYHIKASHPKLALAYAQYGVQADSTNDFVYTNLALGYLLTHDFPNAEKVYDSLKNSEYRNGLKNFKDAFLQDFIDLTAIGIINETNKDIWEEVDRIRKNILEAQ